MSSSLLLLHTAIQQRLVDRVRPLVVGLDGASGAGKSTLGAQLASLIPVTVIDGDDFYSGGTHAQWDARSAEQKVELVIDWRRQRQVLEELRQGRPATYHPFDWDRFGGPADHSITVVPTEVVLLDGVYSGRPELADLVDLRVLLDVPRDVRHQRIRLREGQTYRDDWEARWLSAEGHYFTRVCPPDSFDLLLPG